MRKLLSILILVVWGCASFAQSSLIDSLLQSLEKQQGREKVASLIQLSEAYLDVDLKEAEKYGEMVKSLAFEANDPVVEAWAHLTLGDVLIRKFDDERAMRHYMDAWRKGMELDDRSIQGYARVRIGQVYSQMEDFVQAEENLAKAIHLGEELEDLDLQANASEALGLLYLNQEIYGKSLKSYNNAVDLYLAQGKRPEAAALTFQLGEISNDLGNYDGAFAYYQTCLHLHQEMGNNAKVGEVYRKSSLVLLAQNDLERSLEYANQSFWMARQQGDSLGQAICLKNLALVHQAKNEKNKAVAYLEESLGFLKNLEVTPEVPVVFEQIAGCFAKLGFHDKAYENQVAFAVAHQEYFNQEKSNALIDLTTKYESEFEAKEKQQQIELLQVENAHSRNLAYFLYTVVALIGMLLFTYYSSYKQKKRDNLVLREQNEEIKRQEEEISMKNVELEAKNISLDLLNKKLLSEIAERENIEKSSFARDRFLATMSHEMRTPLNVITGLTHILLKENPRNDQIEHLRTLQFSANDLVVFINDILDFSKIEAGKLNLEDREFDPAKVVAEVKNRFQERADEYNLQLQVVYDEKIPKKLLGDDARLHQILTNLLTNSFQHTEEGHIQVVFSLQRLNPKEALLKIVVEGTDHGMNRDGVHNLFSKTMGTKDDFNGYDSSEFSLSITKRLIELQNGKIEVEVSKGAGTKFTVLLPFRLPMIKSPVVKAPATEGDNSLSGTHILVVEDNKINQLVVSKILKRMGVKVSVANHGIEALDQVDAYDFDLILMDIQMPEMDGYRATSEIRRHPNENKRDVPIIALTASAFLTEKEKAVLFGMNDHVGKPFSPDELVEKIKNCLATYKGIGG